MKMNFYEFEYIRDENLSLEERINILREKGKEATSEFKIKYEEVQKWFTEYDQLYILSFCMFYFMLSKEGYDEEAEKGSIEFPPYYMELLQAFSLTLPYKYNGKPLYQEAEAFKETIKKVGHLNNLKFYDIPEKFQTETELTAYFLRTQMMTHTTVVRNWAYDHQMRQVTSDLATGIKKDFESVYGFNPKLLLDLLYAMTEEVENRINQHIKKLADFYNKDSYLEVLSTYEDIFSDVPKTTKEDKEKFFKKFSKVHDLKMMLIMHSDLNLPGLFAFSIEEMIVLVGQQLSGEQINAIFEKMSFQFNDLKDFEREHFLMGNPVHAKPFIKAGNGRYFSSLWTVMTHLSISILENLVSQNETLRIKYNDTRSDYLENQLEQMVKDSFPLAKVYRGSLWQGEDNKLYENDLLVVIESFALVIEAKSGTISPPAKRGAPDRLFKTLKELIEEPSDQGLRFIEYLKKQNGHIVLNTKTNKKNNINTSDLKFFIPLGVTLSHLGAISTNMKLLIKAGVTDKTISQLAPSINLTDLQVVFDFLPSIAQKLHYLQRRREMEAHIEYMGDEVDLLAWYLDAGFNIGKDEYKSKSFYNIILKSKELDPYIIGSAKGIEQTKPTLQLTQWWKDMLSRLESKRPQQWLENSFILLNVGFKEQQLFEAMIDDLIFKIKTDQPVQRHNWIQVDNTTINRRYVVIGYPYIDKYFDERNAMMEDILADEEKANTKGMLVIGKNIDQGHYPYSVLASKLSTQLFDVEFSKMVKHDK
ncbi:hypothetical protein [Mucilaginibacter sp.]|uniref:hypothetical protein n=1 Tax=Mucilaginibacter sp. TaxID=1882438 RepID=UPI0026377797|nr:hypothetical protein [Mucilaginibacter sp.]MDB4925536.1 hypothetical protein [Mucilaginibacter sp.]